MRKHRLLPILISLLHSTALAQIINDLPQCWQNCIYDSGEFNCNGDALDISCICRLSSNSNSKFLTTVTSCIQKDCDNQNAIDALLSPLQLACGLLGDPIPDSAVTSAENVEVASQSGDSSSRGSGLYTPTPGSLTFAPGSGGYSTDTAPTAAETSFFAQTTFPTVATTVTTSVTDSNGKTVEVLVPVTIDGSTTVFGTPMTLSASTSSSTTDTQSTSTTLTTTSFNGAALTSSIESEISAAKSSASAASSRASASASVSPSSSGSSSGDSGSGSPFDQQGGAPELSETRKKSLLGAAVMVAVAVIWF